MALYYRPLQPNDYEELKAIHTQIFPIAYEDNFYQRAVNSTDRVFSYAAICANTGKLVGFVTARIVYMHECDPLDRHYLGTSGRLHDGEAAAYILTLGVAAGWRKCGVASALLSLVYQHATNAQCRMIFLHVIAYNEGGMRLYTRNSFQCVARLQNFYCLPTQGPGSRDISLPDPDLVPPDPNQSQWDAYLYMLMVNQGVTNGMVKSWDACSMDSVNACGITAANVAMAPFRNALGHLNACLPWFCRQDVSHIGNPVASAAPSPAMPAQAPWVHHMNGPATMPVPGPSYSVPGLEQQVPLLSARAGRVRSGLQQQQAQHSQQQQREHRPSLFESWINREPRHRA